MVQILKETFKGINNLINENAINKVTIIIKNADV